MIVDENRTLVTKVTRWEQGTAKESEQSDKRNTESNDERNIND